MLFLSRGSRQSKGLKGIYFKSFHYFVPGQFEAGVLVVCQSCPLLSVSWPTSFSNAVSDTRSSGFYLLIFSLMSVYSNCLLKLSGELLFSGQRVGIGQSQDRRCAEVEHFLSSPLSATTLFMLTFFSESFPLIYRICGYSFSVSSKSSCFSFLHCKLRNCSDVSLLSALVPYLTRWFLSEIFVCQLKRF